MVIYQQLQAIAPRIREQENVAALGIAAQMVTHQTVQTIKSLAHVRGSGRHVDPRRWPKSEHHPIPCPTPSADAPVWPHRSPGSLRSCVRWSTPPPTRCCSCDFDTLIWPPNDHLNWPPEEENLIPWISFRAYEPVRRADWTGEPKWNYSNRFDGSTTTEWERSKEWPGSLGSTGAWYGKHWEMRYRGSERSTRAASPE